MRLWLLFTLVNLNKQNVKQIEIEIKKGPRLTQSCHTLTSSFNYIYKIICKT